MSTGKQYTLYENGDYHCKVCLVVSSSETQYREHLSGERHRNKITEMYKSKDRSGGFEIRRGKSEQRSGDESTNGEVREAQFGKALCQTCKKPDARHLHVRCNICQICCPSQYGYEQHLAGKAHLAKVKAASNGWDESTEESVQVTSENSEIISKSKFIPSIGCHGCEKIFSTVPELKKHINEVHGFIIKCSECEGMNQTPAEVLTCQELIDHYSDIHNKTIKENDFKFYGKVNTWQGYVRCKLCKIKLGGPGLWFTNSPKHQSVLEAHFKTHHASMASNVGTIESQVVLGCQLCTKEFSSSASHSWKSHLATHGEKNKDLSVVSPPEIAETLRAAGSNLVTSPCSYCGEKVVNTGNAMQNHIKSKHFHLSFRCKMCNPGERYCFERLDDVKSHLRVKHYGIGNVTAAQVDMPGDKGNLGGFAWLKCKRPGCGFTGIGLEAESHQSEVHGHKGGGGLHHFVIFCRLCTKKDKVTPLSPVFVDALDLSKHIRSDHKVEFDLLPDPQ